MLNRASEGRWLVPAAFILLGLLLGTRLVVLGIAIVGLRYDAMVSLATRVARR
ncbi:MAG: hypothetical protein AABM41_01230 [Chloroflexota bacterium]